MKKVSVIIAAYNESTFVRECLANLADIRNSTYANLEVIIKDQASTDGTPELIAQEFPWVTLLRGDNDGLAKAFNICGKVATGDYFLFLGMDAVPDKDTIPGMVDYMEHNPKVGAATCRLVLKDGSPDMDAHRAFPTPWLSFCRLFGLSKVFKRSKVFDGYFLPGRDMSQPHEIDLCISHFMLLRRETYQSVGGYDEDFFLYGEDVDYCYRVKQAGWQIMYLPQWKSLHYKGGSVGIRATTRKLVRKSLAHRLKMQKLSTDAMNRFVKKHYLHKYPLPLIWFMLLGAKLLGWFRVLTEYLKG